MKYITQSVRFIVAVLFIISGLVKLVDPLGFSYKLSEYFSTEVLNLPFLEPFALALSVVFVILEVVLGVFLLLGYKNKFTLFSLLGLIIMFSFLTFYSAYFDKVKDCGCFGDALKLTPWESFTKDIVLLVMILVLMTNEKYIKPLFNKPISTILSFSSLILCGYMAYSVLNYLPWIDFRAYNIGSDWVEGKKNAEELGLEPSVYETYLFLIDPNTKEEIKLSGTEYTNQYDKYKAHEVTDKTETVLVKEGYSSKMQDFDIENENGESVFSELMTQENLLIVIAKDIAYPNLKKIKTLKNIANTHKLKGGKVIFLTADTIENVQEVWGDTSSIYFSDKTVLKTIIRANPGVVILNKGIVTAKWNANDHVLIREFLNL